MSTDGNKSEFVGMVEEAPAQGMAECLLNRREVIVNRMAQTLRDSTELPYRKDRLKQYAADAIELKELDKGLDVIGEIALAEMFAMAMTDLMHDLEHADQAGRNPFADLFGMGEEPEASSPEALFTEREEVEPVAAETDEVPEGTVETATLD